MLASSLTANSVTLSIGIFFLNTLPRALHFAEFLGVFDGVGKHADFLKTQPESAIVFLIFSSISFSLTTVGSSFDLPYSLVPLTGLWKLF